MKEVKIKDEPEKTTSKTGLKLKLNSAKTIDKVTTKEPKTPRGMTRKTALVPLIELCTSVVNSPSTNAMVI